MCFCGEHFPGDCHSRLKIVVIILFVFPVLCLWGACAKEEEQEVQMQQVIVRMKIPPPEPSPAQEKLPPPAQLENLEKQIDVKDKKASSTMEKRALEKREPGLPSEIAAPEKEMAKGIGEGYYRIRKGDTLSKIAGREDVYGDPLKWPSLFRLNMDKLNGMEVTVDFHNRELPQGLYLKFVTPKEAAEKVRRLGLEAWVINVLSSPLSEKVVPAALKLMKHGHRVYITKVMVKEKEWMRLRIGFYKKRSKAADAGNKVKSMLNADDAWVVRIGEQELGEFGGY